MPDGGSSQPALSLVPGALPGSALPAAARERLARFFGGSTICHAVKPRFALLVPAGFDAADPAHRAELGLGLGVAAQLLPGHRLEVLSAADLGPLLAGAQPLDRGALGDQLAGCAFALCLLDRALCRAAAEHVPARLLGSDPAPWARDKQRLTFWDPRAAAPRGDRVSPAALQAAPVLLVLDPFSPLEAALVQLRRLRRHGIEPDVLLPPGASETLRAALGDETGGRVVDEPPPPARDAVLCAQERLVLELLPQWPLRVLLHDDGRLESLAPDPAPPWQWRLRHVLYRGEELSPLGLLDRLLGLEGPADRPPRRLRAPLLSIIVPVYDRTREIEALADSIFRQRYPHLEVLFVSNGSPPETLDALRRAKAHLVQRRIKVRLLVYPEPFGCATIPRDIGAYAARGEFLCFIDSDDRFEPGFFDDFLDKPLDEDAIHYPHKIFRDGGRDMGPGFPFGHRLPGPGDIPGGLYEVLRDQGNIFCNSGTMISRRCFLRAGGIWHQLRYAEDYDLWLRIARGGARAQLHSGAVSITLHPGNNELHVGDSRWVELAKAQTARVLL